MMFNCLLYQVTHRAPNEIDYRKKIQVQVYSVFFFFSDSVITLENVTTCSWNDYEYLKILPNLALMKTKRSMFRSCH